MKTAVNSGKWVLSSPSKAMVSLKFLPLPLISFFLCHPLLRPPPWLSVHTSSLGMSSWCQPGPLWLLPMLLITIDSLCVWCYVLNNTCSADPLVDTFHSYRPVWVCVCVCVYACVCVKQECACVYTSWDPVKRQSEEECAEPAPSLLSPNNTDIVVVIRRRLHRQWSLRWEDIFI